MILHLLIEDMNINLLVTIICFVKAWILRVLMGVEISILFSDLRSEYVNLLLLRFKSDRVDGF